MAQGKVKLGKSHNPAHQSRKQKPKKANANTFTQKSNIKITKVSGAAFECVGHQQEHRGSDEREGDPVRLQALESSPGQDQGY